MRSAGNFHPDWGYLAPAPGFMRTVRIALLATTIGAIAGVVAVVSLIERPGGNNDNTSIASHALVISAPTLTSSAAASPSAPVSVKIPPVTANPPALVLPSSKPVTAGAASADKPNTLSLAPVPTASASVAGTAHVEPAAETAPAIASTSATASASVAGSAQPPAAAAPAITAATASGSTAAAAGVEPNAATAPDSPPEAAERDAASARKAAAKKRRADYEAERRSYAESHPRRRWRDDEGFGPLLRLFSFRSGGSFDSN